MRRWEFMTLIAVLAIGWLLASYAQQLKQSQKRIGLLASGIHIPYTAAWRHGTCNAAAASASRTWRD